MPLSTYLKQGDNTYSCRPVASIQIQSGDIMKITTSNGTVNEEISCPSDQ